MPRLNVATALPRMVQQLQTERQKHVEALARIDETFRQAGINPEMLSGARRGPGRPGRPGRPPASALAGSAPKAPAAPAAGKRGGRRKRGSFAISGEQSVIDFVRQNENPSTAEINRHWRDEGRKGSADNTLTRLVNEGKLKRNKVAGERGSRYQVGR